MFKVNNKNTVNDVVLVLLLLNLNIFHTYFIFLVFLLLNLNKQMLAGYFLTIHLELERKKKTLFTLKSP